MASNDSPDEDFSLFSAADLADRLPIPFEELFRTIVELSPDPVGVLDDKGNFLLVNGMALRLHGLSGPQEILGKNLRKFLLLQDRDRLNSDLQDALQAGHLRGLEYTLLKGDGNPICVDLSVSVISGSGRPHVFVVVLNDVSKVKSMERELRDYATTLEELVAERTGQLEVEKNRVQELLELKTQFVNQLSHDLRTPLTPIITMLPMLGERLHDEKERKWFNLISRNVNYINNLAQSTLALARLDSNTVSFDLKEVSLRKVVDIVLDNNKTSLENASIKPVKEVPGDISVMADELRLLEVLNNLVSNAIKYAPGGTLSFSARADSGMAVVSVADTGAGIAKENLPGLFTEFYKADPSRHEMSSGLGLAICRRIVERHGGRIWVESGGLGKGTRVSFTLPLA